MPIPPVRHHRSLLDRNDANYSPSRFSSSFSPNVLFNQSLNALQNNTGPVQHTKSQQADHDISVFAYFILSFQIARSTNGARSTSRINIDNCRKRIKAISHRSSPSRFKHLPTKLCTWSIETTFHQHHSLSFKAHESFIHLPSNIDLIQIKPNMADLRDKELAKIYFTRNPAKHQ